EVVTGRRARVAVAALVEGVAVEGVEALRHRQPHLRVEARGVGEEERRTVAAEIPRRHLDAVGGGEEGHRRKLPRAGGQTMSSCYCTGASWRAGSPRSMRASSAALSTAWSR